jgi:hypothetical protein
VDPERLAELEDQLIAEAKEQEIRALEALRTGKRSVELGYTFTNVHNERLTGVHQYGGSTLGHSEIALPPDRADKLVGIINDGYQCLDAIAGAVIDGDKDRALQYVEALFQTTREIRRAVGRPKLPAGKTRIEQQAAFVEQHGLAAAATHFGVKEASIERNLRKLRGQ